MTQKELKVMYADILSREVWSSQHMVDWSVKNAAYIVELESGDIVAIEKPRMKKSFCFGYSLSTQDSKDFDRANAAARHAGESEDYFLSENLGNIDDMIAQLDTVNLFPFDFYVVIPYVDQPQDSKLKSIQGFYWHDESKAGVKLEGEDRKRVADGYRTVRSDFEKQLRQYLKRYGMKHINTWSYWRDE